MKKTTAMGLLAVLIVSGCSKKEPPREVAPVQVRTLAVGSVKNWGSRAYSGTIEEQSATSLSFSGLGTVKSIDVAEGQFVKQGQLIGVLDATSARNAYDAALATKQQALDAEQRMKQLHDNGSLPEIKWIEVQTQVRQAVASEQIAKKGLTDTKLYAPFSGYISQKSIEAGANVAPGVPVVKLVKIEQVKAKINVPEEDIRHISKGQTLHISVEALGGKTFTGRVVEKGVSADPLSRSYEVKALIANPHHELLPGMLCEVKSAQGGTGGGLLLLPANIIQIDADNQPFVWTVADGKAQKAHVTLGDNVGNEVVITGGLALGEKVICEGQQKVSTNMKVTEK